LLQRDPAADADMSDTDGIAFLLEDLQEAEAHDQVASLLARNPAARADAHHCLHEIVSLARIGAGPGGTRAAYRHRPAYPRVS
jgi:hypothetical protein